MGESGTEPAQQLRLSHATPSVENHQLRPRRGGLAFQKQNYNSLATTGLREALRGYPPVRSSEKTRAASSTWSNDTDSVAVWASAAEPGPNTTHGTPVWAT